MIDVSLLAFVNEVIARELEAGQPEAEPIREWQALTALAAAAAERTDD